MALTCQGFEHVAREHPGLLPDITKAEILDKSKSNSLGKAVVCLQVGGFVLQFGARLAQHLPITLLEVCLICSISSTGH